MSGYSFTRTHSELTEGAWRPLDRALAHWVRAHGGSVTLASVAAWASLADGMGDAALPLCGDEAGRHGMAPLTAAMVDALRGEALVGDGGSDAATPFVLDADGRFALWRNHAHEVAVAQMIAARRAARSEPSTAHLAADLDALFHGIDNAALQRQREAVASVVGCRLFVLTGGPGSGKTTTVLRMLLMLQRHAQRALSVQVAAPTGKAAQRLVQSLRQVKRALLDAPDAPLPADWQPLLERIPDTDALTLHRLLGFDPRRNVFTHGRSNTLAADVVVVDEASMVDLDTLRALLEATLPQATVVLVGDADQLTSVATGSVFMDLVAAMEHEKAPDLVRLEHSFRAEQHLVPINRAVRAGDAAALAAAFDAAGARAQRHVVETPVQLRAQVLRWARELAQLDLRPILPDHAEGARIATAVMAMRTLAERQLLCALREDTFGALAINALIERELKRLWQVPIDTLWYPGRAVMITRNDYAARLFNGDVGLALMDASGVLRVWFETTLPDGRAAARFISPSALPPHDGAFAITIHKSQGSEYARTAVLLPPDPAHRILSRQLLYTGLSRAKQDVELWATDAAVEAALAHPIRRAGGLAARLSGIAGRSV
ncbi:exodeoxyribonuclease V subunit alpha [Dokdonella soli]|uniref:RecBCD enzyme subunit RecD n=1 Tax=Dokdonella soli TaxID=529810 RepID=A0ABN1IPZ5_9GAMM